MMLQTRIKNNHIYMGKYFSVSFQRTLRIPDDGKKYPLPPGLGEFPIHSVKEYKNHVPESWKDHGGVFIPMYQREAMWLSFRGITWHPCAVKVAIGKVNTLTGRRLHLGLNKRDQNYMVIPDQPWLDGIKADKDTIRQFVAMPLGNGYTVEEQVTGEAKFGGIQLVAYNAKPNIFKKPQYHRCTCPHCTSSTMSSSSASSSSMGLGAGGSMTQKIYKDSHGIDVWDLQNYGMVYIHIVDSMMYRQITSKEAPVTPVTAELYTRYGRPWFELYDEKMQDIDSSSVLDAVKSTKEVDEEKGLVSQQDDTSVEVPESQIIIPSKTPDLPDEIEIAD